MDLALLYMSSLSPTAAITRKQSSPSDSPTRANGGYAGYGTLCARVKRRMAV